MKKIFSFLVLSIFTISSPLFLYSCSNNKEPNIANLKKPKENINDILKDNSFSNISYLNSNLRNSIVNDISLSFDAYNHINFKFKNNDFKIKNWNNSNSNSKDSLAFVISETKDNKYLYNQKLITLHFSALDVRNLINFNWNQASNAFDAYQLFYDNLAQNFNSACTVPNLNLTSQILENSNFFDLKLFQIDNNSQSSYFAPLKSLNLNLAKDNYYFLINVTKSNPYFQLLENYSFNWKKSNFTLGLKNLPKEMFANNKLEEFKTIGDLKNYVYQVITNYYNNFYKNSFSSTHPMINNFWWLELNYPNLVKISLKNNSFQTLGDSDNLQLGQNYSISIQNDFNIFFKTLTTPLVFNFSKQSLDLNSISNFKTNFAQKTDVLNYKYAQDIINFGYQELAKVYNSYSILKNCNVDSLKADQAINFQVLNQDKQEIQPSELLNDSNSYNLELNIKNIKLTSQKVNWFLGYNSILSNLKMNQNVNLSNFDSKDIDNLLITNNVKSFSDVKNAIANFLVLKHNNYYHVLHYHKINVQDVLNDPKISINVNLSSKGNNNKIKNWNENSDYNLNFDQTYIVSLSIANNDLNFKSVLKNWFFTQQRIVYDQGLNVFSNFVQFYYAHQNLKQIIASATTQLVNYYNKNVVNEKYLINNSDLTNNLSLKFNLYSIISNKKTLITNLNKQLDPTKKYQLDFSIANSKYFYDANNQIIGTYVNRIVDLSGIFDDTLKFQDKTAISYWSDLYQTLATFYNQNSDLSVRKISAQDLRNDLNLKINVFVTTMTYQNITQGLNFKPIDQDNTFAGRYVKIQFSISKKDQYFKATKLKEFKYINGSVSLTTLAFNELIKQPMVYDLVATNCETVNYVQSTILSDLTRWYNAQIYEQIRWIYYWDSVQELSLYNPYISWSFFANLLAQKQLIFYYWSEYFQKEVKGNDLMYEGNTYDVSYIFLSKRNSHLTYAPKKNAYPFQKLLFD